MPLLRRLDNIGTHNLCKTREHYKPKTYLSNFPVVSQPQSLSRKQFTKTEKMTCLMFSTYKLSSTDRIELNLLFRYCVPR